MVEGLVYTVARHFHISPAEVMRMSEKELEYSYVWASAVSRHEAEQIEDATGSAKNQINVAGTKPGSPMPFSE